MPKCRRVERGLEARPGENCRAASISAEENAFRAERKRAGRGIRRLFMHQAVIFVTLASILHETFAMHRLKNALQTKISKVFAD
jgi:hypothetical protein